MKCTLIRSAMAVSFILCLGATAMAADQGSAQAQTRTQGAEQGQTTDRTPPAIVPGDRTEGVWQRSTMDRGDQAEARREAEDAVNNAAKIIGEITSAAGQEKGIPSSVLQEAQGIVVIPDVFKGALIVGGRFGRGVLMTKDQGQWSLPVIVTIGGASLGAQIGVESSDMILVFRDKQAIQEMLEDNELTLGADATIAAGSSGAKEKAMTGDADIVVYRGTQGLYAGVSLSGGILDVDENAMYAYYRLDEPQVRAYYGEEEAEMARKVLEAGQKEQDQKIVESAPQSAKDLQKTMNQMGSGK